MLFVLLSAFPRRSSNAQQLNLIMMGLWVELGAWILPNDGTKIHRFYIISYQETEKKDTKDIHSTSF